MAEADSVAVIGLGRFGQSLALELMATGTEVLGIDASEEIVQGLNGELSQVVRADSTKAEVLRQLAVHEFDRVVVAIGSDIQASILTTSVLLQFGIPQIWAKATSDAHGQILEQLGVEHVIYPEKDMGRRVAHLVRGAALDYIEVDSAYAIVKMQPNSVLLGRRLGDTNLRQEHGVTVMAVQRDGQPWCNADADTVVREGDTVLVAGPTRMAEGFGQLR
ncbi:potassium transporter [Yonghaparkia sp. Soil809]|nr:potassium transporter [Yonghaparkia sp. Root332]KRF33884.1 potassium transporter [Yonghaparkia sp. Soil809]